MATSTGPANRVIEGYQSNLSLFKQIPTDTAVQAKQTIYIPLAAPISNNTSPLQFNVEASPSYYYDLKETLLYLKMKITDKSGGDLTAEDAVGLTNLPLSSIFSHAQMLINKQPITRVQPQLSLILAYLDTIQNSTQGSQKSFLQSELFFLDSAGFLDDVNFVLPKTAAQQRVIDCEDEAGVSADPTNANNGLVTRATATKESKIVELIGPLRGISFLNSVERLMLSQVPLNITLQQANEGFRLLSSASDGSYKVQIIDAFLSLQAYALHPEVILAHNNSLTKQPAIYPFVQSEVKMFSVPKGQFSYSTGNLFNNEVPCRVRIVLIKSEALNGKFSLNPFNFIHANVSNLDLVLDGVKRFRPAFQPDFANSNYTDSYLSAYIGEGKYNSPQGNHISLESYGKGFCTWTFDLCGPPSQDFLPLANYGSLKLTVGFKDALENATSLVVIGDFNSNIKIDHVRNVLV